MQIADSVELLCQNIDPPATVEQTRTAAGTYTLLQLTWPATAYSINQPVTFQPTFFIFNNCYQKLSELLTPRQLLTRLHVLSLLNIRMTSSMLDLSYRQLCSMAVGNENPQHHTRHHMMLARNSGRPVS